MTNKVISNITCDDKMNRNNTITFLIPFLLCTAILILNILQGSQIYFKTNYIFKELYEVICVFGILMLLSTFLLKIKNVGRIRLILFSIILSSALVGLIEPEIFDYQLDQTNKNLEALCDSIEQYQKENKKFPDDLFELEGHEGFKSGFYLIGGEFEYKKTSESKFYIYYWVKHGMDCEAWNCSTFIANMKYTSVVCGSVHNTLYNYE